MEDCEESNVTINGVEHTLYTKDGVVFAECRRSTIDGRSVEEWFQKGKRHHDSIPAKTISKNGQKIAEYWYQNNKLHCIDRAAEVHYDEDGRICDERWYLHGKRHRDGLPAWTQYENGEKISEHWYRNGLLHRDGMPAMIIYSGEKPEEYWYRDGNKYTP